MVERGKRAYQRIKQDSATMRENWRAVGEALLVGRGMYKSTKAFGAWCKEHFPELHKQVRADAMWLAENWAEVNQVDLTICHPMHIRKAFNEARAKALVSPEDDIEATPSIILDERSFA